MDLTGLGSLFDFGKAIIERIFPDPAQRAQATLELAKLQQTGDLAKLAAETDLAKGQLEINKIEAASPNMFIAGWRPAVGWICGIGLGYATVLYPLGQFVAELCGYKGTIPAIDTGSLVSCLVGLLGLGGMRTFEKFKGAESNR